MEILLLVSMATEAFNFIKDSCEMYKEGRQLVTDAAKEVEGVVGDIDSAKDDVLGVVSWIKSLFGIKPPPVVAEVVATPKPVKKKKQPAPAFDENLIFSQVSDALVKFFKAYNALKAYKKEQEELALHVSGEEGNEIAIKLVIANLQMEKLNDDLNNYMVYMVPAELKDLYTRVNEMIGHIANQQALARKKESDRRKHIAWQKQQRREIIQDRVILIITTLIVIAWTWGMILTMTH